MSSQLPNSHMLTEIMTATQQEVTAYLCEGAIGHIHRALKLLADGCQKEALLSIDKAVSILIELSGSLNYDSVAQHRLAVQLDGIYNYLIGALTQAGASGDLNALDESGGNRRIAPALRAA